MVAGLYADDTVLLTESEGMLQRIVDEFDRICKRRKLKVNAGKSKIMVFETAREQTINFVKPYRVGSEAIHGCKIWLGQKMLTGAHGLERKRKNKKEKKKCICLLRVPIKISFG